MADLRGTVDDDLIVGTGEDDLYFHDGGDDTVLGGLGNDRLMLFSAGINFWEVDLAAETAFFTVDTLSVSSFESITSTGSNGIFRGDHLANEFVVFGNGILAEGRGGNDTLNSGFGRDVTLSGGAGDDLIISGTGAVNASGGSGTDHFAFLFLERGSALLTVEGDDLIVTAEGRVTRINPDVETVQFNQTEDGPTFNTAQLILNALPALTGTQGADQIIATPQDRNIQSLGGDDWITLIRLADARTAIVDGGSGNDTASFVNFADISTGIRARMDLGYVRSGDDFFYLENIEQISGTRRGDVMVGDSANNTFRGLAGGDAFFGSQGADTYKGGAGSDRLIYKLAAGDVVQGVAVSLLRGRGTDGMAEGDRITNVERIFGTITDDVFTGDHGNNKLYGEAGNDVLIGNGGNDLLSGGLGQDTVIYSGAMADYEITRASNGFSLSVEHIGGAQGDGSDILAHVEVVRFADQDFLF